MPQTVLIAALGDHPAVVTGMVKALSAFEQLTIDTLHVIHPQDTGKDIAQLGYPLIEEHLCDNCQIVSHPMPFSDANTRERSMLFLQTVAAILAGYQDTSQYNVYLSLAGGRKNMAALMAVMPQFFPAVRGLYHLLDRQEGKHGNAFPSIDDIVLMDHAAQLRALDPPLAQLNLVPIPYPRASAQASELWRYLRTVDDDVEAPIPLTPEGEAFYRTVFEPAGSTSPQLEVWLTRTAFERYQAWESQGSHFADEFMTCFEQMRDPMRLKARVHGSRDEFSFYKRPSTRERPFYYTQPNPIHLYPQRPVERVVICGLAVEQGNGQYEPTMQQLLETVDREPVVRLRDLKSRDLECTLLVPLGKTPMIATQTYTLLQLSEEEGCPRIPTVAVLYPRHSGLIRSGVGLLKAQFGRRGVEFLEYPIHQLRDVDSQEACQTYLGALLEAISSLRQRYPRRPVALSLSGGRKGMSALTLFAAQRAGIPRVFHTLIRDPNLEAQIEESGSLASLQALPTDEARAERLFLEAYPREAFVLFTIPVILQASGMA